MSGVQGIGARREGAELLPLPPSEQGARALREPMTMSARTSRYHMSARTSRYQSEKFREATWDQLVEQVEQANRFFLNHHTHLEFSIHKETKEIIIRIVDSETQEVLKEIPPEKLLDLVAKLWEMAGLLIDEKR
ncbi:MAG TPA: flagellar protein FlaG [Calditerricola sp.]